MKEVLKLELNVYQALLDLHNVAQSANDPQVQNLVSLKPLTHSLTAHLLGTLRSNDADSNENV